MDQSGFEKNRKSTRSHLFMKAVIEFGGRQLDVKLRNLSAEGALLAGEDLPVEGTEVLFKREGLSVPARVAWSADGRAGISFAQALEPDVVRRHVPQPRARQEQASRRPGLKGEKLSDYDRRYAEEFIFHKR